MSSSGIAIALDFDGVCKLLTDHKHQIMFTCLFLHCPKFQRVPFDEFREAYLHINFRSRYAGKARFLCVTALSEYLAEKGHPCALPGMSHAVQELAGREAKISAPNLASYKDSPDVAGVLAWSDEVNQRLEQMTEIKLTAGIRECILDAFKGQCDFYIVSTATEDFMRNSLKKEGIDFIRTYYGQERATKTEALTELCQAGYEAVAMFGDSLEDSRASLAAAQVSPPGVAMVFVPVIPGDEKRCFETGGRIIGHLQRNDVGAARKLSADLQSDFDGNEAGTRTGNAPMTLRG